MTDVPNPELTWLRELLAQTKRAVAATPDIDAPTKAIGPGTAWTGTRADKVHDNLLAPNAKSLRQALVDIVHDVQVKINSTPATVPAATAQAMNKQHAMGTRYN